MQALTASLQRPNILALIQVIGASLVIALFAQINVYLPWSPVPLTGQTMAVLLIGACLGSWKGMLSVIAYVAESMMGLPVLAGGSVSSLAIVGPTGGYIVGMVAQAYIVGWFSERKGFYSLPDLILGCLIGVAVQLSMGVLWLGPLVGWENVLSMGLIPFIPGEMIKVAVVCLYMHRSRRHA